MKTSLLISVVLVFTYGLSASAGTASASREISGQSLSEKQIRWVWQHRKDFVRSCLIDELDCTKAGTANIDVIKKIYAEMAKTTDDQIQFVSERQNPDLFKSNLGETHRIAITGKKPGEVIYFNSDRLTQLTLENMVAIVFHELTHHLGYKDDAQRLPDQIGSQLALHFQKNTFRSPYSGDRNLQLESVAFQVPTQKNLDEEYFYTNFSYFTDGEMLFDTDLGKFVASPACDTEGFALAAQRTQTPHWKEFEKPDGTRGYQLILLLNNLCFKKKFLVLWDHELAQRNYQLSFDLTSEGRLIYDSVIENLAYSAGVYLDYIATLQLKKLDIKKTKIKTGETQSITLQVKSLSPLQPKTCQLGIGYEGTPMQAGGVPVVTTPGPCEIRVVGKNLWELRTEFIVSADTIGGNYFVRNAHVGGEGGDGAAYLGLDEKYGYAVENTENATGLKILSVTNITGNNVKNFGEIAITNSSLFHYGERVTVQIQVQSRTPVVMMGLQVYEMQAVNGKLETVWGMASPEDFVGYDIRQKSTTRSGELQILEISWQVPQKSRGNVNYGFSLQQLMIETGSAIVSWKAAGPYDFMFIEKSLADMNP